jgi:predicted ATPase
MRTLETLTIRNFKSIREQTLKLGPLNVFIGGNGSGKSNMIEVFRFLREIVEVLGTPLGQGPRSHAAQRFAAYTAIKGGADSLLYFGRRTSPEMSFLLEFGEKDNAVGYAVLLTATNDDSLVISREQTFHPDPNEFGGAQKDAGQTVVAKESNLRTYDDTNSRQARRDIDGYRVYHFHDTSDSAPMRGTSDVDDNRLLRPQAENLAAFLYWMQEMQPAHMSNIQDAIRQVAPFFDEFRLAPSRLNPSKIRLEWKHRGSDMYFNASSLSDGTLRFICLATLLLQPELPSLVLLDEPELGLHPAAVTLLASLLSSAATRTQVIVATQSVTLVNQFEPEQVWAVDREDQQSVFRHLSSADMSGWLEDYALGELWEKNVLGARP